MINLSISETLELQDCRKTLQCTLKRLDMLGAGIAAIHVNAAIEQLTSNLEAIGWPDADNADLVVLEDRATPEIMH